MISLRRAFGVGAAVLFALLATAGVSWLYHGAEAYPGFAFVLTVDEQARTGEILAFNHNTVEVVARVPTSREPDFLATPSRDRLYVLDTQWSADWRTPTHVLRLLDTATWKEVARTTVSDRILYGITGPSGLVLAPDGSRLFVYSYKVQGDDRAEYWLAALDARSLQPLPLTVPLPHCGGARFVTAKREIVALCNHSNALHFIDPKTGQVVATVTLPTVQEWSVEGREAGIAVSRDGGTVYVVTNDLRILVIKAADRSLREVTEWAQQPRSVPLETLTLSLDGSQLIVGVRSNPWQPDSPFSLHFFDRASLTRAATISLPRYTGFAPGPGNSLYLFPSAGGMIRKLELNRDRTLDVLQVQRPVHRFLP